MKCSRQTVCSELSALICPVSNCFGTNWIKLFWPNAFFQCPSDAQKTAFINAVKKGYINWHAGPMNLQIEMAEPWLFEFGIDLGIQLDARFNITRAHRALSQRDVPGKQFLSVLLLIVTHYHG